MVIIEGTRKEIEQLLENWYGRLPHMMAARQVSAPQSIFDAVKLVTGRDIAIIEGASRSRLDTYARHLVMYLLQTDTGMSTASIATLLHRDHATVIMGVRKIAGELATREETVRDVGRVRLLMAHDAEGKERIMMEAMPATSGTETG